MTVTVNRADAQTKTQQVTTMSASVIRSLVRFRDYDVT